MINMDNWVNAYMADPEKTKRRMVVKAIDELGPALEQGYYDYTELVELNYSEICDWLGWPDLQDGGIFEQCIELAADTVLSINGYKSRAEIKALRK